MTTTAPAAQSFTHHSRARVPTDRPARYGKQLASHMGRKITTSWDEQTSTGTLIFDREGPVVGVVTMSCDDGALLLELSADEEHLASLEQIIGIHLARFGAREALAVTWTRPDGEGSTQGPLSPEDLERRRPGS
ncbi:DUF2218 domain-containing protein [Actinomyces slackii]|uniref:Uncharacterized protein conserved in bacteria (DUF2218) n=1 Tax=Actinomyces slackii TaxID=52774 RepID=A0A448KB62_9ACTO|nr:DUF2218 domain-containing protein [Actinomyces slackii]VEG74165.1 Uncharacterized protein conserved in bacteria (DUF2218) [Actinomyces slackii]